MRSSTSSAAQARELLRPIEQDLLRLLAELVRMNTVALPPRGRETEGQLVLAAFLKAYGVEAELYDTAFLHDSSHPFRRAGRDYTGRLNLLAAIPGTGRGRSLLFNGHMDTVPPGEGWSADPWSGEIRGGRLYGRGSFDMKGGLAAQFAALCALQKAGLRPGGDLLSESVVDEEWGGGGGTLAARLRGGTSADAALVAEGTGLEIALATRGGAIIDLLCEAGDATGYFSQSEVVSPALPLGRLLGWLDGWAERRRQAPPAGAYRDFPDPAPVQVLAIEANRLSATAPWAVPLSAGVRAYFQFLPHEDTREVLAQLRESLAAFCASDPFFRHHPPGWKPLFDPPLQGHELAPEHPWSRCFIECAGAALASTPRVTAAPYPCDAFLLQREFGIPTLLFGPRGGGAHNPNEYVEVESVLDTARVFLTAALEWCGA
jgi:acetylornithine deacetylase